jgi:hypothetical protein
MARIRMPSVMVRKNSPDKANSLARASQYQDDHHSHAHAHGNTQTFLAVNQDQVQLAQQPKETDALVGNTAATDSNSTDLKDASFNQQVRPLANDPSPHPHERYKTNMY